MGDGRPALPFNYYHIPQHFNAFRNAKIITLSTESNANRNDNISTNIKKHVHKSNIRKRQKIGDGAVAGVKRLYPSGMSSKFFLVSPLG